jgi:hypothetical protein
MYYPSTGFDHSTEPSEEALQREILAREPREVPTKTRRNGRATAALAEQLRAEYLVRAARFVRLA